MVWHNFISETALFSNWFKTLVWYMLTNQSEDVVLPNAFTIKANGLFPRFSPVAHFPALFAGCTFSIGSIVIGSVASLKVQHLCLIFNACYTIPRSSDWGIFHGVPSMKRNKWRVNKFIVFDTMILLRSYLNFINNFSQTLLKTSQQNLPWVLQDLI